MKRLKFKYLNISFIKLKRTQGSRRSLQPSSKLINYLIFSFFLFRYHFGLAGSRSGSTDPIESELNPDPKQSFKQNNKPKIKAS